MCPHTLCLYMRPHTLCHLLCVKAAYDIQQFRKVQLHVGGLPLMHEVAADHFVHRKCVPERPRACTFFF